MPSEPQSQVEEVILTGTRGEYSWLTSSHDHYSGTLVKLCPEIFIGHYLAVTAIDSGTPWLTERQQAGSWAQRREIVYSPLLNSVDDVFYQRHAIMFRATTSGIVLNILWIWVNCSKGIHLKRQPPRAPAAQQYLLARQRRQFTAQIRNVNWSGECFGTRSVGFIRNPTSPTAAIV